jgi:hypothetical protein
MSVDPLPICATGDLFFSNSYTITSTIQRKMLDGVYGHAGLIIELDGEICVYDISATSHFPVITELNHYIRDPGLTDIAVRRLIKPLGHDKINTLGSICEKKHKAVTYPAPDRVLKKITAGKGAANEMLCSELIESIVMEAGIVKSRDVRTERGSFLPEKMLPGRDSRFDAMYASDLIKTTVKVYSQSQAAAILDNEWQMFRYFLSS